MRLEVGEYECVQQIIRRLDIYAILIGLYSVLSVWGFLSWQKTDQSQLEAKVHVPEF
jgi:hypothetical protein